MALAEIHRPLPELKRAVDALVSAVYRFGRALLKSAYGVAVERGRACRVVGQDRGVVRRNLRRCLVSAHGAGVLRLAVCSAIAVERVADNSLFAAEWSAAWSRLLN